MVEVARVLFSGRNDTTDADGDGLSPETERRWLLAAGAMLLICASVVAVYTARQTLVELKSRRARRSSTAPATMMR